MSHPLYMRCRYLGVSNRLEGGRERKMERKIERKMERERRGRGEGAQRERMS